MYDARTRARAHTHTHTSTQVGTITALLTAPKIVDRQEFLPTYIHLYLYVEIVLLPHVMYTFGVIAAYIQDGVGGSLLHVRSTCM